jgi:glycosyltransferase 2 family protein
MQPPEKTVLKRTRSKDILIWSFSILLALVLVYHFAYKANWKEVAREISEANYLWVFLAVLGEIIFLLIRVARWKIILAPLEKKISNWSLLKATVVSFAISGVAPAKLGEVARPVFLSRWEGIPLTTSVASIALERGLDLIAIIILWFLFLVFGTGDISPESKPYMDALNAVSLTIFILGVIFIFALLWFARKRKSFKEMSEGSSFLSKSPILGKLVHHFFVFAEGLQSFQKKRMIALLLLVSVLAWGTVSLTCYFAPKAVGIDLPKSSALLILVLVSIGASLPTPGGVGGVHKAIWIALVVFYGLPEDNAVSAALLGHAVMFLPSIIWGGLYLLFGRIKFSDVSFSPTQTGEIKNQGGKIA